MREDKIIKFTNQYVNPFGLALNILLAIIAGIITLFKTASKQRLTKEALKKQK